MGRVHPEEAWPTTRLAVVESPGPNDAAYCPAVEADSIGASRLREADCGQFEAHQRSLWRPFRFGHLAVKLIHILKHQL